MRRIFFAALSFLVLLAPGIASAQAQESDPLAPCLEDGKTLPPDAQGPKPDTAWGVVLATDFDKQKALDQFSRMQDAHEDLLGDVSPIVVPTCDLSLGQEISYSVRIGADSRDAADDLCGKLQAGGVACVVEAN